MQKDINYVFSCKLFQKQKHIIQSSGILDSDWSIIPQSFFFIYYIDTKVFQPKKVF